MLSRQQMLVCKARSNSRHPECTHKYQTLQTVSTLHSNPLFQINFIPSPVNAVNLHPTLYTKILICGYIWYPHRPLQPVLYQLCQDLTQCQRNKQMTQL